VERHYRLTTHIEFPSELLKTHCEIRSRSGFAALAGLQLSPL